VSSDDQIREEVERTSGVWAQMTLEQKSRVLARLHDKKQRARAARARRLAEKETLERRLTSLEERIARLER